MPDMRRTRDDLGEIGDGYGEGGAPFIPEDVPTTETPNASETVRLTVPGFGKVVKSNGAWYLDLGLEVGLGVDRRAEPILEALAASQAEVERLTKERDGIEGVLRQAVTALGQEWQEPLGPKGTLFPKSFSSLLRGEAGNYAIKVGQAADFREKATAQSRGHKYDELAEIIEQFFVAVGWLIAEPDAARDAQGEVTDA